MELADITMMLFTVLNSIRVLAYLPQIWKAATDDNGAKALSYSTWSLFLMSNAATAAYAGVNKGDWMLAATFVVNAGACATILLVAAWRRSIHQLRVSATPATNVIQLRPARIA